MNNTLLEGDYIFVNKMAYGSRLPITPLSIHIGNKKYFLDWIKIPYIRLPGYTTISRNDILVFNLPSDDLFPVDEKKEYVKRCIGLPGDTISIKFANVYINGAMLTELKEQKKWYALKPIARKNNAQANMSSNEVFITNGLAESLLKSDTIASIEKKWLAPDLYSPGFFPHAPQIKWNPDHFGPLYIPKRGQTITLNQASLLVYQRIIEIYEANTLTFKQDSIFINGKLVTSYTFKMDYFFVLGDNRYHSIDSRFWGLVPEDHIIGKAESIIFSSQSDSSKSKRSFILLH